ncbi:MAG: hypothetical protein RLZZ422_1972 [Pseudomonadota bacterium]|jgi:glycosyltransferase involved in cell wall biosynthesis
MRIAYIDPHPVPDELPETMQILQTVDAMGASGVKVSLITPASSKSAELILDRALNNNVQLIQLSDFRKRWWYPKRSNQAFYWQATYWVKKNKKNFDAILIRNLRLAEHLLRIYHDLPIFFETHELFAKVYEEENTPLNKKSFKKLNRLKEREYFVYSKSRSIIALTPFLIEDIETYYSLSQSFVVAPDGVDLELANKALAQPKDDNYTPIILYLGSLHPWKGVDFIIRVMPNIERGILWVAGGDQKRINELKDLAINLKVINRVFFLGSVVPKERFHIIHKADVCVLPLSDNSIATRYTSPLKLFEYLAMGKLIVIPNISSVSLVVSNKVNAFTFKPSDLIDFAKVLNDVISNLHELAEVRKTAIKTAENYSWTARAKTIIKAIT